MSNFIVIEIYVELYYVTEVLNYLEVKIAHVLILPVPIIVRVN